MADASPNCRLLCRVWAQRAPTLKSNAREKR